jgi:hypothetical protein
MTLALHQAVPPRTPTHTRRTPPVATQTQPSRAQSSAVWLGLLTVAGRTVSFHVLPTPPPREMKHICEINSPTDPLAEAALELHRGTRRVGKTLARARFISNAVPSCAAPKAGEKWLGDGFFRGPGVKQRGELNHRYTLAVPSGCACETWQGVFNNFLQDAQKLMKEQYTAAVAGGAPSRVSHA